MLKRLELENFKSVRQLDLELGSLNVLIGRNGSGKSNFLSFFQFMRDAAEADLTKSVNRIGGFTNLRYLNAQSNDIISWKIHFDSTRSRSDILIYDVELSTRGLGYSIQQERLMRPAVDNHKGPYRFLEVQNGNVRYLTTSDKGKNEALEEELNQELALAQIRAGRYPVLTEARSYIKDWNLFRGFGQIELANIRSSQLLNAVDPLRLDPSGSNLISILQTLANQSQYEETYDRILEIMSAVFPDFVKFDIPIVAGGQGALYYRSRHIRESIPASLMSDGQLRFLGLVMLLMLPDPPSLIAIDEPEIGMHPKMIDIFAELLLEAQERTQIIVATHSPQLIDSMKPEHILVVEQEDGETKVHKPDEARLSRWLERYTLGRIWTSSTVLED